MILSILIKVFIYLKKSWGVEVSEMHNKNNYIKWVSNLKTQPPRDNYDSSPI